MVLMEIATVVEEYYDLRISIFKTNSPFSKTLVLDHILIIIQEDESETQILSHCIKSIRCLAQTFLVIENIIIFLFVKHIYQQVFLDGK